MSTATLERVGTILATPAVACADAEALLQGRHERGAQSGASAPLGRVAVLSTDDVLRQFPSMSLN